MKPVAPGQRTPWHDIGETVDSDIGALNALAADGALVTLSEIASQFNEKPTHPETYRAWEGFNLVVGDTFEDRLLFWNYRLLASKSVFSRTNSLRVPSGRLSDDDFLDALGKFLDRRAHIAPVSNPGQPETILR